MSKLKITCFRYKRYNDIYASDATFSYDKLLSILGIFPDSKVIVLIESNANYTPILLSIGESIGIVTAMFCAHASRYLVACNIKELLCLLSQVNMDDFEGLFIASVNKDIISDEFMYSLEYTAMSLVKNGISDISISFNFPENQIIISLIKEKYAVMPIKDKICSFFKG